MRSQARTSPTAPTGASGGRSRAAAERRVQPGRLHGQVLDAESGEPVRDAAVTLAETSGAPARARCAAADEHGRFTIPVPRAADALLVVGAPSYVPEVLGAPSRPAPLVVRLSRAGAISGRLAGAGGVPAAGVRVVAVSRAAMDVRDGMTDGAGRFSLDGLRPGRYLVTAFAGGGPAAPRGVAAAFADVRAGAVTPVALRAHVSCPPVA